MTAVVFLTHNYPRYPGDVPGAFLATLAQALVARGVRVSVVAPSDEGATGDPVLEGIPVRRVRYATPEREKIAYRGTMAEAIKSPGGWRALLGLYHALREGARQELAAGADLVHAHWWVPSGLAAPREAPLVVSVHGTDVTLLKESRLGRFAARRVFRRARVITAVSSAHAQLVAGVAGTDLMTRIQPMPVRFEAFARSKGGAGLIVVSRLTRQKRVDLALSALTELPGVALTIVGDGPERSRLEEQARDRGIADRVRFVGMVPPARVGELLASADLMLLPALNEGFGLSAAEALMAGVPVVVCRDGGGLLDIVPENGAGRRTEAKPQAIAEGVKSLQADGSARESAWSFGQLLRTRLNPDSVAANFEGWYREALGV